MHRFSFITAGFAVLLFFTNPGEEAYAEWAVQRLQSSACEQPASAECYAAKTLPRSMLKSILKQYSYRQNFVFFSVYRTMFLELKEQSIGVGGYFVRYKTHSDSLG